MNRITQYVADAVKGSASVLGLPAFVAALALATALPDLQGFGRIAQSEDSLSATKWYAAALAAESSAVWRRDARPVGASARSVYFRAGSEPSRAVAEVVDSLVSALQTNGRLPRLTSPVVIVAADEGRFGFAGTSTADNAYPPVNRRFVSLPDKATDACVVSTRFLGDSGRITPTHRRRYAADATPCILYAAFGEPGPQIRAWLDSTQWLAATGALFAGVAPPTEDNTIERTRSAAATLRVLDVGDPWRPSARYGHAALLGCLEGASDACTSAALRMRVSDDAGVPIRAFNVVTLPIWRSYSVLPQLGDGGELVDSYVRIYRDELFARLLADLGPDRFRRVWQSSLALPESYARETREPFGAWGRRFLHVPDPAVKIPRGAEMQSASLWWISGAVLLSLGLVVRGYHRAQLG